MARHKKGIFNIFFSLPTVDGFVVQKRELLTLLALLLLLRRGSLNVPARAWQDVHVSALPAAIFTFLSTEDLLVGEKLLPNRHFLRVE